MIVPNQPPTRPVGSYRLAIIGEAPGENELAEGKPFVGFSGQLLFNVLAQYNILRDYCFVGNICQHHPTDNKFSNFNWNGPEIQSGLTTLKNELTTFKPNLCLLLGNNPLFTATGDKSKSVSDWRGSLFTCTLAESPFVGYKCLPTYHPAAVLRTYNFIQYFRFDLCRAAKEAQRPELYLPNRRLLTSLTLEDTLQRLATIKRECKPVSIDIEGGYHSMSCISFATSPDESFSVPLSDGSGNYWKNPDDECLIWQAIASVLCDPLVPKILQNYLYDAFITAISYNMPIRGLLDDTMLKHWEAFPELEKSLGVQASIYTNEPFYKFQRKTTNFTTFWEYNARDSAVTYECNEAIQKELPLRCMDHYRFNLSCLAPLNYMQLRGIRYDTAKAHSLAKQTQVEVYELQEQVNCITGCSLKQRSDVFQLVVEKIGYKHTTITYPIDIIGNVLKPYKPSALRIAQLLGRGDLTNSELGELSSLADLHFNVDSHPAMCTYLYETLRLPKQYKKVKGKRTDKLTADQEAVLKLYGQTQNTTLLTFLLLKGTMTRLEYLSQPYGPNQRMYCSYNLVGGKTGRTSCAKSAIGCGYNLQTVMKPLRCLFLADEGHVFAELDLSGADSWTVAARCAQLGDPTMLDDILFGLKPAKIIALMYKSGAIINTYSRDQLKTLSRDIRADDGWLYYACKRILHGTHYGMKADKLSAQLLKDSYKLSGVPIVVPSEVCAKIQNLMLMRYRGVARWQVWCNCELKQKGYLVSASGNRRIFFGRRKDAETQRKFYAHEPQHNTTYVTNLALMRLWNDPSNRYPTGDVIIKPVHVVHDALCVVWPMGKTEESVAKMKQYFQNPITVGGIRITIPFEGHYGPSWGEHEQEIV